jgi:hypothetical protein
MCAALIGGVTYYKVKSLSNTLSVTGSATATTTADIGKLRVSVSRTAYEGSVPAVQARVEGDTKAVVRFFTTNGISENDVQVSPAFVNQNYMKDDNAPQSYNVQTQISVQSHDPALIDKLSKDIGGELSAQGVLVSVQQPEFYISNLPEMRIALIGKAVSDAKARAEGIAESTGQKVGRLQSASSGVVQVMSPNSIEVSDYGSYDTSTIEKQVMVTARATFQVK